MRSRTMLAGSTALIALALQAGLCGAATAQSASPASTRPAQEAAQDPDAAATVDEVVVTGFRQSLANALNQKRRADVMLDAISADDIASFPEANIAESLQRIPGVSIDRENGEGRQISVRGLGGDFTRVRINGMEALSTSGTSLPNATVNANTSRAFDFNAFASQLFNNASVRKTASAQTDEGSLGATVDLTTARPFDFRGPRTALSAEAAYYENGEYTNPRLAALFSSRWFDGRLGLLGSIAYQARDTTISSYTRAAGVGDYLYRGMEWAGNEYPQRSRFAAPTGTTFTQSINPTTGVITNVAPITNPLVLAAVVGSDPAAYAALYPAGYSTSGRFDSSTVRFPALSGIAVQDLRTERTGMTGSLQFQASDRTRITVDGLYSKFHQVSDMTDIETVGFGRNNTNATLNTLPLGASAATRRALYSNSCTAQADSVTTIAQDCGQAVYGGALVPGYSYSYNPRNLDPFEYYNNPLSPGYAPNAYGINGLIQNLGTSTMKVKNAHVTDGHVDYLQVTNMDMRALAQRTTFDTEFSQVSTNIDHQFTDNFRVNIAAGMSKSSTAYQTLQIEFNSMDRPETFTYDARGGGDMPIWDPGFNVADPTQWGIIKGYSVMRNNNATIDNEFRQLRADFVWDVNDNWSLLFGGSIKEYDFIATAANRNLDSINPTEKEAGVTTASLGRLVSFGQGLNVSAGTPTSYFAPDINKFNTVFGFTCNCINEYGDFRVTSRRSNAFGNNFKVSERDEGVYAQLNFNGDVFGRALNANVGLRSVLTSVDAAGKSTVGQDVFDSNEYRDNLPSLNASYNLTDSLVLRLGWSEAMARPSLGNLSPGVGAISIPTAVGATTGGTITIGNTHLEPFRSENSDLALEWYFRPDSVFSIAVFNKEIGSYPQTVLSEGFLADLMTPEAINALKLQYAADAARLAYLNGNYPFAVRQVRDAPGGWLRGVEVNFQTNFWFLPGFWSNFGMQLNATKIESELNYILDPGASTYVGGVYTQTTAPTYGAGPWVNASPEAVNFTFYYEVKGFSARTSLAWRSDYYTQYPIVSGTCSPGLTDPTNPLYSTVCANPLVNDFLGAEGGLNVDAVVNWDVSDRLALRFEALNLTNQTTNRFAYTDSPQVTNYGSSGSQYTVGLRYRY